MNQLLDHATIERRSVLPILELPDENALAFFCDETRVEPIIASIRAEIATFTADPATRKGRDAIATLAHKVTKSKTAIEAIGKRVAAEQKEIPKKIDATRRKFITEFEKLHDEVRAPLDAWETTEAARLAVYRELILKLDATGLEDAPLDELEHSLKGVRGVDPDTCEEFAGDCRAAQSAAIARLDALIETRTRYDAEQAELAQLRAERALRDKRDHEEKIAREAAERGRREAEEAAARHVAHLETVARLEREAADRKAREAEQREADLKAQTEAAETRARDAEAKAAREHEANLQRAKDEAIAREKDLAHRKAIMAEAIASLVAGGVGAGSAKLAVTLIAGRKADHLSIAF